MNRLLTRLSGCELNGSLRGAGTGDRKSPTLLPERQENDVRVQHPGIARSLEFLRLNCCQPISVGDLMTVAGLSRRGFLKAFRKHTGHTPGKLLRHQRIEHAKQLLAECDTEVREIAVRCGFRSANSFGIAFRQVTGMAPTKFQGQRWLMDWLDGSEKPSVQRSAKLRIEVETGCHPGASSAVKSAQSRLLAESGKSRQGQA